MSTGHHTCVASVARMTAFISPPPLQGATSRPYPVLHSPFGKRPEFGGSFRQRFVPRVMAQVAEIHAVGQVYYATWRGLPWRFIRSLIRVLIVGGCNRRRGPRWRAPLAGVTHGIKGGIQTNARRQFDRREVIKGNEVTVTVALRMNEGYGADKVEGVESGSRAKSRIFEL